MPSIDVSYATVKLINRYRDAYFVAKITVGLGTFIKIFGALVCCGTAVVGAVMAELAGQHVMRQNQTVVTLILGFVGLLVTYMGFYMSGVLVCAKGQHLMAALDSAVNSSPFLSDIDKLRAMGFEK